MDPQNNSSQSDNQSSQTGNVPPSQNANTASAPQMAVHTNTLMSVLAYLGPLVIISYIVAKDDPFVKFHIKQGLLVFGIEVLMWVFGSMAWGLWMILQLVNFATLVLSIIGIVNAVQGKQKELPLIGHFAGKFSI